MDKRMACGFRRGGMVHGPGTGTSDSIPARLSDGEFVMPADSVKAIGLPTLEAMRKATHKPVRGFKPGAMADGGPVEDPTAAATPSPAAAVPAQPTPTAGATTAAAPPAAAGFTPQPTSQWQTELNQRNLATTASSILPSAERTAAQAALAPKPPAAAAPGGVPTAAPAPAAGSLYEQGLQQRNLATTASSIVASPERAAARAAMGFQPQARPAPAQPAATMDPITGKMSQPWQTKAVAEDLLNPPQQPLKMADGGMVDDEKRRQLQNVTDPVGAAGVPVADPMTMPQAAPVRTMLPDGVPTYPEQMRKVGGFIADGVRGAGQLMRTAGGALADANVTAFKHLVSAPGYGLNSPALQSAAAPAPEPTAATQPQTAPAMGFNAARDSQAAAATAAPAAVAPVMAQPASAPATSTMEGSITKTVGPDGRVLYSNVGGESDASLMARGLPSKQNVAAADALDARSRAETAATLAASEAPTGPQGFVIGDGGGYGLRDKGYLDARAKDIDQTQRVATMTAGLPPRQRAQVMAQLDSTAASRENNAASNATQRYGYDVGAARDAQRLALDRVRVANEGTRLGFDAARTGADVAHSRASTAELQQRTGAQQQVMSAQQAYQKALATGDQKLIDREEANLRAITGKWEKSYPELFSASTVGGGVDPATGLPRPQTVVVTDKRNGTTRIVNPQDAAATQPKYEAGKVYQDAQGRKAKWDGSKFVPA